MTDVVKTFEFGAKAVPKEQPQFSEHEPAQTTQADLGRELAQLSKQERQSLLLQMFREDLDHLVKLETEKGREQGYREGSKQASEELEAMKAKLVQQHQDHLENFRTIKTTLDNFSPTIEVSEPEALIEIVNQAVYTYLGERLEDKSYLTVLLGEVVHRYADDKQVTLRLSSKEFAFLKHSGLSDEFDGKIKLEQDAALSAGSHRLCLSNGDKHSDLPSKLKQQLDAFLAGLKG